MSARLDHTGVRAGLLCTVLLLMSSANADPPDHPHHDDRARATHRFDDPQKWSAIWDHPSRDEWQEPERIVEFMKLEPGMKVADIGAGTGYFNPHLSAAVGHEGTVYAFDVEESLVEHMTRRAEVEETANVVALVAAFDDPGIPTPVDRILMVDTYHHIDHRVDYFRRLRSSLAEGGLLIDVDWKPGKLELGPAPKHKISPEEVAAELAKAGWELVGKQELKYQYVLILRPTDEP